MCRALIVQTPGYLQPVNAMHPVKGAGNITRLVGLDWADKVPGDIAQGVRRL